MPYYALLYEKVIDDFIARRAVYRDEHLRLAREAQARGELLMAGAFADPPDGALLIFQADDASIAEAFARNDPYVKNGLVTRWKVRSWSVVIGNEASRSSQQGLTNMIARLWSARTTPALASLYLAHFSKHVQPILRTFGGYAGSTVLTREASESVEILVMTLWRSIQAIEAFSGPDREAAVVAREAAALLTSFDKRAVHYELALAEFPQTQ